MTDDETNPWRWIGTAKVGQPSEVIVEDRQFSTMHVTTPVALLEDGKWYVIEPPARLHSRVLAWRYVMEKPHKIAIDDDITAAFAGGRRRRR